MKLLAMDDDEKEVARIDKYFESEISNLLPHLLHKFRCDIQYFTDKRV